MEQVKAMQKALHLIPHPISTESMQHYKQTALLVEQAIFGERGAPPHILPVELSLVLVSTPTTTAGALFVLRMSFVMQRPQFHDRTFKEQLEDLVDGTCTVKRRAEILETIFKITNAGSRAVISFWNAKMLIELLEIAETIKDRTREQRREALDLVSKRVTSLYYHQWAGVLPEDTHQAGMDLLTYLAEDLGDDAVKPK